jgi:hypothetical protein
VTRADIIKANDELRTQFKGGVDACGVGPGAATTRASALPHDALSGVDEESDHSEGVFIFAGYTFVWRIEEFAGERSISLMLSGDF